MGHLPRLANRDSFDIEFSPSGKILRETKYNCAGEVLGSEHFTDDDNGRTVSCIQLDAAGFGTERTDFERHSENNRIVTTARSASGEIFGKTVEVYEGNLLSSFSSYDEKGNLRGNKTFYYEGSRLLKSDSRYYIPGGTMVEQWLSEYDSNFRIVQTYAVNSDQRPLGDGKYKYEYGCEGRESRVWSFNDLASDAVPNAVTVYEYSCDEPGNWIERREFFRFRSDSNWSYSVTTREIICYSCRGWLAVRPVRGYLFRGARPSVALRPPGSAVSALHALRKKSSQRVRPLAIRCAPRRT